MKVVSLLPQCGLDGSGIFCVPPTNTVIVAVQRRIYEGLDSVIIVSKSALCVGCSSPERCVKAVAPIGFPSSQPLSPELNQLAPWRGPVDSAKRPVNTSTSPPSCRSANQH